MSGKKVYELSAASGLGLNVELSKLAEKKRKDRASYEKTGVRIKNKPLDKSVWKRVNRGVEERSRFDRPDAVAGSSMEDQEALRASQISLERKSKIYDKLAKDAPEFNEMDDEQLIDFERKKMEHRPKATTTKPLLKDDPWVEYIDEFGRTRLLRQSEVKELQASDGEILSDDEMSDAMDKRHEREEWERQREEKNKGPIHYDADQEHRTRGVGYYKFSNLEEERKAQMEELTKMREDTARKRALQQSIKDKRNSQLQERIMKIRQLQSSRNPKMLFPPPIFARSSKTKQRGQRPSDIDLNLLRYEVRQFLKEIKDLEQ